MPSRIHRNPGFQPFALGFILDDDAYRELQNVLVEDPGRGKSLFDDLVQSLKEAKELDINLSREFEAHLVDVVRLKKQDKWLAENREALEAYNEHVECDGVFSDGLRGF